MTRDQALNLIFRKAPYRCTKPDGTRLVNLTRNPNADMHRLDEMSDASIAAAVPEYQPEKASA